MNSVLLPTKKQRPAKSMSLRYRYLVCCSLLSLILNAHAGPCDGSVVADLEVKSRTGGATKYGWLDFSTGPGNGVYKKKEISTSDSFHYHKDHEQPDGSVKTTDYTEAQNTITTLTATGPAGSCTPEEPVSTQSCSGDLSVDNTGNCGGPKTCSATYQQDCTWSSTDCRLSDLGLFPPPDECDPPNTSTTATSQFVETHCYWYTDFEAQADHQTSVTLSDPFTDGELLKEIAANLKAAPWPSSWTQVQRASAGLSFTPGAYCGDALSAQYHFKLPATAKDVPYLLSWFEITKYPDGKREAKLMTEVIRGNGSSKVGQTHPLECPNSPGVVVTVYGATVKVTVKDDSGNGNGSSGAPGSGGPNTAGGGSRQGGDVSLNADKASEYLMARQMAQGRHEAYGDGDAAYSINLPGFDRSSCTACGGSTSKGMNESGFNFMIYMGTCAGGFSAGAFQLSMANPDLLIPTPGIAPYVLSYTVRAPDVEMVMNGDDIRQVRAPQAFADVITVSDHKFEIRFYLANQVGPKVNDLYTLQGGAQPFAVWTVENTTSGQTAHVAIKKTVGLQNTTWTYDYSSSDNGWTLLYPGNLKRERTFSVTTGAYRVVTLIVDTPGGPEVYRMSRKYKLIEPVPDETHELLVEESEGTSNPLVTTYTYDETVSFVGTAEPLQQVVYADGSWERYVLATDGTARVLEKYMSHGNQAPTSDDSLCRHIVYAYDSSIEPYTATSVTEYLLGTLVSKKTVDISTSERTEIKYSSATSLPEDEANIKTVTTYYTDSGPTEGLVKSVKYDDGTMTFTEYAFDVNGLPTGTTEYTGQPNTAETAIVDGTVTVTEQNAAGELVSKVVRHIPSNIVLASATYSNFDDLNRPGRVTFLDGTHEDRVYDCCGLETFTDRDGVVTQYGYDAINRHTTTARLGITTVKTLDAAGNVKQLTRTGTDNSQIIVRKATFDLAGRQLTEENALTGTTAYGESINGSGQLIRTVTYPDTGTTIETFYKDGRVQSRTGTAEHPARFVHSVVTDSASSDYGSTWVQEIKLNDDGTDSGEWMKSYTDLLGHKYKTVKSDGATTQSVYNDQGQLIKETDADGVITLYAYNGKGELEYTVLDMNRNSVIDFDGTDRISRSVKDVVASHGTNVRRTRIYVWTTPGQNTSVLDSTRETSTDGLRKWDSAYGLERFDQTVYGTAGARTVTSRAADNSYVVNQYQSGRLTSVGKFDANGVRISYVTYTCDAHGRLYTATDARTGTTTYTYNNADQVVTTTTPIPATGQSAQVTTSYYDTMGRIWKTTFSDNTDTFNEYYKTGALKKTYGSRTYPLEYTYDSQGRVKTLKTWKDYASNQGAATTTWNYDSQSGFLTSKVFANSKTLLFSYKLSGRTETRTWARGVVTTYGYDNAGGLQSVSYSDSTPAVSYSYDRQGRRSGASRGSMSTVFTLNDAGQVLSEAYSGGALNGLSVNNHYDSLLRRDRLTTVGIDTTYGYDAASRFSTIGAGDATATYAYYADSSLVNTVTMGIAGTTKLVTTKTYDNLNRLANISSTKPGNVTVASFNYEFNQANKRTRTTLADSSYWLYQYDNLGQVTSAKKYWADGSPVPGEQLEYAFDNIGNRSTTKAGGDQAGQNLRSATYTANAVNQYSERTVPGAVDLIGSANPNATVTYNNGPVYRHGSFFEKTVTLNNAAGPVFQNLSVIGVLNDGTNPDIVTTKSGNYFLPKATETFTYDDDGNLLTDGRWTYTWDGENQLVSMVANADVPVAAKQKVDFEYDFVGRRIKKQFYTWNGGWQLSTERRFVYDGWNMVLELNADQSIRFYNMWGLDVSGSLHGAGGVGGLLVSSVVDNYTQQPLKYSFAATDGNGNIAAFVRDISGVINAEYEYGPFGEVLKSGGDWTSVNSFGFSSKYTDKETGLVYYGYRYYNPATGAWLSRDPLQEEGGINLYNFVSNDPVNSVDELGLLAITAQTSGEYTLMAGPTPIPGTGYIVKAFIEVKAYQCCSAKGTVDEWLDVSIGIDGSLVGGGSFAGKEKAPNSRGSKYRNQDNKKYAKGPKAGDKKGPDKTSKGTVGELKPCPKKANCDGFAEGYIKGQAGIGIVGGEFKLKFPIYPEFKKPSFEANGGFGTFGAQISMGAKGGVKCQFPATDPLSLFE